MLIRKLQLMGFKFNLVLADSLYGESGTNFIAVLDELDLNYLVAHGKTILWKYSPANTLNI